MERLRHSKIYPYARKFLVGLLTALIVAFGVMPFSSSAKNVSVTSKTGFTVQERTGALIDYGMGEQFTKIQLDAFLQVNDMPQQQMLLYSTQHTSKVFVGSLEEHHKQADPYVFDVQINSLYTIRYILYQYGYYDEYGDLVPAGFQIYVRQLVNNWQEDMNPVSKRIFKTDRFVLKGSNALSDTEVIINTVIDPPSAVDPTFAYANGYADGYNDGYEDTLNSGLSEEQSAIGIILAPLTAITRTVQNFIYSMFDNPVGWVFIGIGALLIIVVVVLGVFKFIR